LHELTAAPAQMVLGQSFSGTPGWHLLFTGGDLDLQTDGGITRIVAAFRPERRAEYKIDVITDEEGCRIAIDAAVIAKGKVRPFVDVNRNLTIGGRPGSIPLGLIGEIRSVKFSIKPVKP
jgi:hypothetical protein